MDNGSMESDVLPCPFCAFSDSDPYFLTQHVELCHPENELSPFIATEEPSSIVSSNLNHIAEKPGDSPMLATGSLPINDEDYFLDGYVDCPQGCGEIISAAELSSHLDLHLGEGMVFEEAIVVPKAEPPPERDEAEDNSVTANHVYDDIESYFSTKLPKALRNRDDVLQPKHSRRDSKADSGSSHRRMHKSRRKHRCSSGSFPHRLVGLELGPYAHEKQMPSWLRRMLEAGAKVTISNRIEPNGTLRKVESVANETSYLIPVLSQLCQLDETVERAFLCNPAVRHIFKMPKEGGFCGYRNIQMLISYIQDSRADGHEQFPGKLPTILRLQDLIEQAWDLGFNSSARIETGGIKGTRKYIGTSEAQALFLSLGIVCTAGAFSPTKDTSAHDALLGDTMEYFLQGTSGSTEKVIQTELPPIYFQHEGHSLTVVGFETHKNGSTNLLVFDPMFKTSPAIERLIGTRVKSQDPGRLLKAYRRGFGYLQKYKEFEILKYVVDSAANPPFCSTLCAEFLTKLDCPRQREGKIAQSVLLHPDVRLGHRYMFDTLAAPII
ncbi:hypothetical protein PABG_12181 [Paracoccidioides brasiliensis Pb03]|nr:hypothetical protein PABG_12181 [Paracoccidioides brasiliensis Pb03]